MDKTQFFELTKKINETADLQNAIHLIADHSRSIAVSSDPDRKYLYLRLIGPPKDKIQVKWESPYHGHLTTAVLASVWLEENEVNQDV